MTCLFIVAYTMIDMIDGNKLVETPSALVSSLTRLKRSESSKVRYELLSGSLVWSDELPSDSGYNKDCLRYVLKYRTGLIIGEPDSAFATVWQEALRLYPILDWFFAGTNGVQTGTSRVLSQ